MSRIGWIIILIIWIVLGLWFIWNCLCGGAIAAVPAPVKDKCDIEWNINDGNRFKSSSAQHIGFKKNTYQRLNPTQGLTSQMEKVANYLKTNKERAVTITGHYDTDEKNGSVLPNLGLARADNVKSWLTKLGVPATQIETNASSQTECWTGRDGTAAGSDKINNTNGSNANSKRDNRVTLNHGISMAIGKANLGSDRIADIKNRLFGKPVTVYFDTNAETLNLNPQQRTDFADLFYYLERVKGAKLDVGGHTDNVGNVNSNVALSKERAAFVKNYLVTKGGVPTGKMDVNGFGPNKPVQTNATPEGRKLNRRVEVTLK